MMRPNNIRVERDEFFHGRITVGHYEGIIGKVQTVEKTEVESSLGITTCHFNSIRHERLRRGQVTVCQPHCSAIYRPTSSLFAYKRETRSGFSMPWAAPLPSLSLGNLEWSRCANRMLHPAVIYEFWVDLPEHFRYCFPGNPGQLSTSQTRDLACAMLPNVCAFDSRKKRYLSSVPSKWRWKLIDWLLGQRAKTPVPFFLHETGNRYKKHF